MNAVERARELGTEHGTRAAEKWFAGANGSHYLDHARGHGEWCASIAYEDVMPQPDLSSPNVFAIGDETETTYYVNLDDPDEGRDVPGEIVDAYSAAFTAAVETTIRARCEETGR